jgi:hypothetical protein
MNKFFVLLLSLLCFFGCSKKVEQKTIIVSAITQSSSQLPPETIFPTNKEIIFGGLVFNLPNDFMSAMIGDNKIAFLSDKKKVFFSARRQKCIEADSQDCISSSIIGMTSAGAEMIDFSTILLNENIFFLANMEKDNVSIYSYITVSMDWTYVFLCIGQNDNVELENECKTLSKTIKTNM